jgi:hypothetical protein
MLMMRREICCLIALICAGWVSNARADCTGPVVDPELISKSNFKPCDPEYKFDSPGSEIAIPKSGECTSHTWDNVPSEDGTEFGSVTVKLCYENEKISFKVTDGVATKVYVKGGPGGNLYTYDPGQTADCGLVTPTNPNNKKLYGLSHVSFCLVYVPPPPPVCEEETAWSAGTRYVEQGNWATYTKYEVNKTVDLIAGQTYLAGKVHFSAPSADEKVTITIALNPGFSFQSTDEPVKVQDYFSTPPAENPAPGQFKWKDAVIVGNEATIIVPSNNYYGVHVDVLRCK